MNVFEGLEPERGPEDFVPGSSDLDLFARVEGLMGEEQALLAIPHDDRAQHHHDRLKAIGDELDRVFERLRDRAERRGRPATEGERGD
jgi:hypothetical protein